MVNVNGDDVIDNMTVVAKGAKGKKTAKVSVGGSFEIPSLNDEEYSISLSTSSLQHKMQCEEKKIKVDKTQLNQISMECSVEKVDEIGSVKGGSFGLMAVAILGLFIFIERDRIRRAF